MDDKTHSFIVRVWREKPDEDSFDLPQDVQTAQETWRGWIEAVGSGHRLYFQDLQSAFRFIQESAGIKQTYRQSWLRKLFKRLQND